MTSFVRFFLSLFGLAIRKPAKIGEAWTGYGPVNRWHEIGAGWIADLAKNGLKVAHIELIGWGQYARYAAPQSIEKRYRELVMACRMYGVTLLVSLVNDNKGSGKYGDDRYKMIAYMDEIQWCIDLIRDVGSDFVWVQPVGETQTATGTRIEQMCVQQLGGFTLIYNGGSRPLGTPPGFHGFAFHPMNTRQMIPAGAIVVTDTSPILIELQGDLFGAHADRYRLEAYGRQMTDQGNAIIHYGFMHPDADKESIKALRR